MAGGPRIFIGIGSNLEGPVRQVAAALHALAREVELLRCSGCYQTTPWGVTDQPVFVNAVAQVRTSLEPAALLACLQRLEQAAGRRRDRHWGPRVLDLDLLAWGDRTIATPALVVPHPRLAERAFVLVPWAEIAPDFEVPGLDTVARLLAACSDTGSVIPITEEDLPCMPAAATPRR